VPHKGPAVKGNIVHIDYEGLLDGKPFQGGSAQNQTLQLGSGRMIPGFEDGILTLVPSARVAHIGMYRDEETLEPHFYFLKYPKDIAGRDVLIVDPMLATGGSADMAITKMKELGCKNIKLMILVAAPEGVKFIYERHPDVDIYCAALDDHLNENGYIVPGLGDAGDRIFGTK